MRGRFAGTDDASSLDAFHGFGPCMNDKNNNRPDLSNCLPPLFLAMRINTAQREGIIEHQ